MRTRNSYDPRDPNRPSGNEDRNEDGRHLHLSPSSHVSMGYRRGCAKLFLFLLMIGLGVGGWFVYQQTIANSPESAVESAHQKFNSDDTKTQIAAIKEYQRLLQKKDPLSPAQFWVRDERDTLYRRIVVHEFKFQNNQAKASEWIIAAWDEGIRDLRIQEPKVKTFWEETVAPLKRKALIKDKNT